MSSQPSADTAPRRWRPAFDAFFVFAVFGPIAGAFFAGAAFNMIDMLGKHDPGMLNIVWQSFVAGLMAMTLGAMFAFWFGGVQAALVGAIVGSIVYIRGRAPLWSAFATAIVIGIAATTYMGTPMPQLALLVGIHAIAGVICWLILERATRRRTG